MLHKILVSALASLLVISANCQSVNVISGPMPGYSTMREVGIWLQLNGSAQLSLEYWKAGESTKSSTSVISTDPQSGNTAKFELSNLDPGSTYEYKVLINGVPQVFDEKLVVKTQQLWQYRTDPPIFKVALASCIYVNEKKYDRPGKPYGEDYMIFNTLADQHPDLMLWLGDNTYLREVDFSARSGYIYRYTHTRSLPEMQRLLRSTHHYAIWDDHDFGPNDANGSWVHKDWALDAFKLFWMNPSFGLPELKGITTAFRYNDVDFFLLDNRYHRSPSGMVNDKPQMLGKRQLDWLIEALKTSNAPFKMVAVGGQVLNSAAVYENMSVYEEERRMLMKRIIEEQIKGVVFLTGDRHRTELSRLQAENGTVIYDLTISPLTSSVHSDTSEVNKFQVDGTMLAERNFGLLEFSGPRKSRTMKIVVMNAEGKEKWTQTIAAEP